MLQARFRQHIFQAVRPSTVLPRPFLHIQAIRKMASIVNPPRDPNTLSNYNNFITTKTTANLEIDFEKKYISGTVVLELTSITEAASQEILLDSSHLNVKDVKLNSEAVKWELLPRFEPYGSILKLYLSDGIPKGKKSEVSVSRYRLYRPSCY